MRLSFQERGEQVVEELEAGVRSSEYKMKQISTNNVHHINSALKQQSDTHGSLLNICRVLNTRFSTGEKQRIQETRASSTRQFDHMDLY